jgi:hypothetical protein
VSTVLTENSVEKLARRILAHNGIAAIWDTHIAAAAAYGLDKLDAAAELTEIADASERLWLAGDITADPPSRPAA